jgi:hypothetical protein
LCPTCVFNRKGIGQRFFAPGIAARKRRTGAAEKAHRYDRFIVPGDSVAEGLARQAHNADMGTAPRLSANESV